jgi:acyl carrier protein
LEIEAGSNAKPAARGPVNPATIRAMSKEELYKRLVSDIANVAALDRSAIQPTSPLSSMMDSLTLSQFKGLLESHYAVSISDDYLFKDSTTPQKLVEVAKLGYADDDDEAGGGSGPSPPAATNNNPPPVGEAPGLAGALGCPPGVRCVIL